MREKHLGLRFKLSMYRPDTRVRHIIPRKCGGKDSKECVVSRKQAVRVSLKLCLLATILPLSHVAVTCEKLNCTKGKKIQQNYISSISLNCIQYFGDATKI